MDSVLMENQFFFGLKGHKATLTYRLLAQPVSRPAVLNKVMQHWQVDSYNFSPLFTDNLSCIVYTRVLDDYEVSQTTLV